MTQPTKGEFQKLSELVAAIDKRVDVVQKDAEQANYVATKAEQLGDKVRDEVVALKIEEVAALRTEIALLRQRLDDHLKRVELWDGRRWGLIVLLIGAVFSLASGLIVALSRK